MLIFREGNKWGNESSSQFSSVIIKMGLFPPPGAKVISFSLIRCGTMNVRAIALALALYSSNGFSVSSSWVRSGSYLPDSELLISSRDTISPL